MSQYRQYAVLVMLVTLVISCCDYADYANYADYVCSVDFISWYIACIACIALKSLIFVFLSFFCDRYRKTAALSLTCPEERSIGDEMIQVYLPVGAAPEQPLVFHYQKGTLDRIGCTFSPFRSFCD